MATTFPSDKNTYESTDKIIRQTECQYKFLKKNAEFSIRYMGDVAEATQLAASYRQDTIVPFATLTADFDELSVVDASKLETIGKVVSSVATTKKGCGTANIVISVPYNGKIIPDQNKPEEKKIVTWTEKSTKYQFPLEVYAGDVTDSSQYADAGAYQGWLNTEGSDPELYKTFSYKEGNSTIALSGVTLELAKKHYAGIENVERSYPEVIRTSNYSYIDGSDLSADEQVISEIDEDPNLYQIDETPTEVWKSKFDGFSWLKVSYDVETQETEYEGFWNATVTESWIGVSTEERGPWDANLYGTGADRWKFFTALSGDGGNNNG